MDLNFMKMDTRERERDREKKDKKDLKDQDKVTIEKDKEMRVSK
eukprot:CAMPEP_0116929754 /NCGR_PEP_ID=MMETSP0467-20121206/26768_1 /TAXON_ID=283647 /ORGANISM="Mesodinium pulex, Strain SPMC105" /LENGTH=43 /DNA_ID= /DNA_START= /DNA_END= /DNA_ORIENTATION=